MTAPLFISDPVAARVGLNDRECAGRRPRLVLAVEDHVPGVALIEDGGRHRFRGVHRAAAAQRDDHVAGLASGRRRRLRAPNTT
jgi:hypothetical protein